MFKLLRYFTITSLIAFVLVAVLLGLYFRRTVLEEITIAAESKNVALTQTFANSLWPEFVPFVNTAQQIPAEELPNHPEIARLHQAVTNQMRGSSIIKVKVYDLNGLTVFSTEAAQIGENKWDNAGYQAARAGQVASELTFRDTFSAFEGEIEDRNVLSSYVPLRQGNNANTPIEGVIEIYDDVTPLVSQLNQAQRNVIVSVIAILTLLFFALFFIVQRADKIIRQQHAEVSQRATEMANLARENARLYADAQREIAERTMAEQALRTSEERFRQVIISINDHVYMTEISASGDSVNHYLSPNVALLTGYPYENFANNWEFWPSTVIHPDDRSLAEVQLARFAQGEDSEVEYRLVKADGDIVWVRDNGRAVRDADTGNITVYGVVSDITGRKQAEQALQEAYDQTATASLLKSRLLANVSHDIRTPLGAILGYTEMLKSGIYGDFNEEQHTVGQYIIASTEELVGFVNNLIGQAEIESGKIVLNSAPFAPEELMAVIQSTAQSLAYAKNLQLVQHIEPTLPSPLMGDLYWLRQILINLVSNSVKFTRQGTVSVRFYPSGTTHWAIEVSDTGPGIPPESQAQIFEAFQKLDTPTSGWQTTGSGLGLSIVRELTHQMGGRIELVSEPEQGTTFTIILPLIYPQSDAK
ncbi:MAG: hypothetical protein Kow0031_29230 [Anaerolineae bacterium]